MAAVPRPELRISPDGLAGKTEALASDYERRVREPIALRAVLSATEKKPYITIHPSDSEELHLGINPPLGWSGISLSAHAAASRSGRPEMDHLRKTSDSCLQFEVSRGAASTVVRAVQSLEMALFNAQPRRIELTPVIFSPCRSRGASFPRCLISTRYRNKAMK